MTKASRANEIVLEIHERFPFAGGMAFGEVGPYERIKGRARFRVDPKSPAQAGICDLEQAPVDADGMVAFASDISILRPVDMARGNRRLFFDWGNRGNIRCLQFFNDAAGSNDPRTVEHAGNGFLMRRGYTLAWAGWQADLLPGGHRFLLDVPVASQGGKPITGPVRVEYIVDKPGITTLPLSSRASTRSHPTASRDTSKASLTRRRYPGDARSPVAADAWMFARTETGQGLDAVGAETAIVASDTHIYIPAGFEPGWIYELVYEGRDPLVLGLGHAAVRDFVAFLKSGRPDARGNPNPVSNAIEKAYGWGRSQTGRCIRDFVYRGFNAAPDAPGAGAASAPGTPQQSRASEGAGKAAPDAQWASEGAGKAAPDAQWASEGAGKKVFDGLLPHVAGGGLMWMNHRFANVIVAAGQQYEDHENPADRFPFAYAASTDHLTGRSDAICKRPGTDPLIFHTQTSTEYWQRRGSLVHTDSAGNDLDLPANVRAYLWSSSQHFADPLLKKPNNAGVCQNVQNVVWTSMLFRALLDNMDAWATSGTLPPESRIPKRRDGSLVDIETWRKRFPAIQGVMTPKEPNTLELLDFGPDAARGILAEPPRRTGRYYTVLVPAVDADGNEVAGVRAPMVEAPLATYAGWNLRMRGQGHGAMHEFTGSTIPFVSTASERVQTRDPRPSIAERYPDAAAYQAAIGEAARRLVAERLMLAEDVERCIAAAANWHAPRHDVKL